jgi:hypothetical protein
VGPETAPAEDPEGPALVFTATACTAYTALVTGVEAGQFPTA